MNFAVSVIGAIFLAVGWIPSSGGLPVRAHQEAANTVGRLLKEDGGVQTVLVVSNDGRPDHFASVQAAVDAVPMWNYLRWVIYIKPGVYYGTVIVPEGKVWPQLLAFCISLDHNLFVCCWIVYSYSSYYSVHHVRCTEP